jgi:uncharacterized protein
MMNPRQTGLLDRRQFVVAAGSVLALPKLRTTSMNTPPSRSREFIWRRDEDNLSFERARYYATDSGVTILGSVYAAERAAPLTVSYELTCDTQWRTSALSLEQIYRGERRTLRVARRADDSWEVDGVEAPALHGCTDVDLGISPSTNAIPVNRLGLSIGRQADVKAAWIRFPGLEVVAVNQSYARVAENSYRFRNLDDGFTALLATDADGFPTDYEAVWRQVANGVASARDPIDGTDHTDLANALLADAPHPSLGDAAAVFAPLVGTWDLTCKRWTADGKEFDSIGVWYFGWILDGRMMQDVIYFFSNGNPRKREGGTTLRRYDPEHKEWRVTFYAPARNAVISLNGGLVGNRVVLHGIDVDGSPLRWSFNDVTRESFRWIGEISADGGKTWRMEQEMLLKRRPA